MHAIHRFPLPLGGGAPAQRVNISTYSFLRSQPVDGIFPLTAYAAHDFLQKCVFMFNASYRVYLFAFLIFCVCSSKNIIIYNEETLVAASFCLFVLFVFHYFGNTLKEALDERGENIKVECQNFLHHKQHFLEELSGEHEKIGQLGGNLSRLMDFTKETITHLTRAGGESLETTFSQQIIQKCAHLRPSQGEQLQDIMAKNQLPLVLCRALGKRGEKPHQLDAKVLKNAIQLLISTARK